MLGGVIIQDNRETESCQDVSQGSTRKRLGSPDSEIVAGTERELLRVARHKLFSVASGRDQLRQRGLPKLHHHLGDYLREFTPLSIAEARVCNCPTRSAVQVRACSDDRNYLKGLYHCRASTVYIGENDWTSMAHLDAESGKSTKRVLLPVFLVVIPILRTGQTLSASPRALSRWIQRVIPLLGFVDILSDEHLTHVGRPLSTTRPSAASQRVRVRWIRPPAGTNKTGVVCSKRASHYLAVQFWINHPHRGQEWIQHNFHKM